MTPSERLELGIFHFAERGGKAQWQPARVATISTAVQVPDWPVVADALHDLHSRRFMEIRRWDYSRNGWLVYDGGNTEYFAREFSMRVTFSGRKYFESLEASSSEPARSHAPTPDHVQQRDQRTVDLSSEADAIPPSNATLQPHHPRAFVSHSSQDRLFVERFATDLRANGIEAWYSGWEIKPGDSIRGRIDEGLAGCDHFLIVLSKESINRPWVQTELDAATVGRLAGKVKKIIPVKIEACGELPPTLGSLCWEDFSSQPYETALNRVLDSIFDRDVRPPLGIPPAARLKLPIDQGRPEGPYTQFPISIQTVADFAKQLSAEGFDARSDLFNGQVGLIVGPKGLEMDRVPPDEIGLFLPLWELNHVSNRELVIDRRFHDLVERRPAGWTYNRPYQQGERAVEPSQRHWSRSASLLSSKALEDQIQRELATRFPPSTYPVNIDVVGGQSTYAVVQINDFGEINEMEKAIPEDYLGRGGMLAAVVAVTERVLSEILNSGRLNIR
jgi:TIR domain